MATYKNKKWGKKYKKKIVGKSEVCAVTVGVIHNDYWKHLVSHSWQSKSEHSMNSCRGNIDESTGRCRKKKVASNANASEKQRRQRTRTLVAHGRGLRLLKVNDPNVESRSWPSWHSKLKTPFSNESTFCRAFSKIWPCVSVSSRSPRGRHTRRSCYFMWYGEKKSNDHHVTTSARARHAFGMYQHRATTSSKGNLIIMILAQIGAHVVVEFPRQ